MQDTTPPTRPDAPAELVMTFFYYRDLPAAMRFYEDIMGLSVAIDQGWCKIYLISGNAHVGLVDENHGMQDAVDPKPVQLCLRVPDVDAWYAWIAHNSAADLGDMFESTALGIRAFVFNDPEGYQIEIQSVL